MKIRLILVACAAVLLAAPIANAHRDPNRETTRCDTWFRPGHQPDTDVEDSHEHESGSDVNNLRPVANTEIHGQSGHYVVRNDYGYVEVVGGQAYRGPDPSGNSFPGQGGYVQGEVDPVAGQPDADFNVAFFGPDADHPPAANPTAVQTWVNGSYGKGCVNVAGQQVSQQTRQP